MIGYRIQTKEGAISPESVQYAERLYNLILRISKQKRESIDIVTHKTKNKLKLCVKTSEGFSEGMMSLETLLYALHDSDLSFLSETLNRVKNDASMFSAFTNALVYYVLNHYSDKFQHDKIRLHLTIEDFNITKGYEDEMIICLGIAEERQIPCSPYSMQAFLDTANPQDRIDALQVQSSLIRAAWDNRNVQEDIISMDANTIYFIYNYILKKRAKYE